MEAKTPRARGTARENLSGVLAEAELYRALLEPDDFEHVFDRVLSVLRRHLSFDWAGLLLRDTSEAYVLRSWAAHPKGINEGLSVESARSLSLPGIVDLPGAVCDVELPVVWGQPLTRSLCEEGLSRVLFAPLGAGPSPPLGLLLGKRAGTPFHPVSLRLLEAVSGPLGRLFDAAGRERELEKRVAQRTDELKVLYDISRSMGTTLRDEDLIRLVMESVHELMSFDLATVLLDLPGTRRLDVYLAGPVSLEGRSEAAAAARNAFRDFAGRPAAEGPIATRHLLDYEPEAALVQSRLASRQAVALFRRGEVVGTLVVLARRDEAFPETQVRLLHTIANHVSLSLDQLRSLQEAEELRVQSIIDSMPQGVVMTDPHFRVAFANPAAKRALEVLAGEASPVFLTGLGGLSVADIARPVLEEGRPAAQAEIHLPDPRRTYTLSISPISGPRDEARPVSGILIVITDVTDARMMQEQLQQSEKLSAIGEMISGVAHELNNPLASVMGFAQLLRSAPVEGDVHRKLEIIYSEAQRCQRVVQNLLSLARKHRPETRPLDLNGVLSSVVSLLAYQLRVEAIEVRTDLDPSLPSIQGDFHLLQQVFLNIIHNAHQAMRDGEGRGIIEVRTRRARADGGSPSADSVQVEIQDTGPGISPENLKRIFDPFFTTKQPGQGTGLGLSLAYSAVREHGGHIYARSQLGQGTTFVIELPSGAPAAMDVAEHGTAPTPRAGLSRSILVVEDETRLSDLLVEVLSAEGHCVECAVNGLDALERIRTRDYDVIISDIKMPHMDGRQLYEQVRLVKPEMARRMIFSTGDVASAQTQSFFEEAGVPFLVKPFDIEDVHRTIGCLPGQRGT